MSCILELKEPIKVIESELYDLVIEDANGVSHFFLNGKYDGYDRRIN